MKKKHIFQQTHIHKKKTYILKLTAAAVAVSSLLAISANAANLGGAIVSADILNLRSGGGLDAPIIAQAPNGSSVVLIEKSSNDWYKVWYDGIEGYMSAAYLNISYINNYEQTVDPNTCNPGDAIVAEAMKYLGAPYVWAGMSPSGFDCSGFVGYVYKQFGYNLDRTAAAIASNGCWVDKSELLPGDILCFSTSGYIGHVGIYIGNGQFIHASTSTTGVIISDLYSAYYIDHYHSARRVA